MWSTNRCRRSDALVLCVVCVPMFLVLLDVTAMNVAMPTLGRQLHVPVTRWPQVVDAYTVPLAVALLPGGWLVDRCGPRGVLATSAAAFAAASTIGGLATGWDMVLLARAGQGLAAAVMLPAGLAALATSWRDPTARARALGTWSSVSAVASALGPASGGLLVSGATWRSVFWVNVPFCLVVAVGAGRLPSIRPPTQPSARLAPTGPRRVCLVGSLLTAGMMTSGANGSLQVVTVHLQRDLALAPVQAGLVLLLATAPFVVLGPVSGRAVSGLGRAPVAAAGLTSGGLGLVVGGQLTGTAGLVVELLSVGLGLGLMTSAIVGESLAAWPRRPGVASGLNNALRQVGTSVGVTLGGLATGAWHGDALLHRCGTAAGLWWIVGAVVVVATFTRRPDD